MRSVSEIAIALVIVFALGPGPARAQTCHRGTVYDDAIAWETETGAATLLTPVTAESVEGGVIEGAAIAPRAGSRAVRLRTRQPIDGALRPPLVRGPQRVVLASPGGEPVAFEPRLDGPLERHVGYAATRGIDRALRHRLEAQCGSAPGIPLYVDAERPIELAGELSRPSDRRQLFVWVGGVLLLVASAGGAIAYRRLRDHAAIERADALLEERYRELDRSDPGG